MGLWDKLKTGLHHSTPGEEAPAAEPLLRPAHGETGIEYDSALLPKLHKEHAALLSLATDVENAARQDDLASAAAHLQQFSSLLTSHLYNENLKLYLYLQSHLPADSSEYREMRRLRKEMDGIGITVSQCIGKYQHIDQQPELKEKFLQELGVIVPILKKRIATEEGVLYAMYKQLR